MLIQGKTFEDEIFLTVCSPDRHQWHLNLSCQSTSRTEWRKPGAQTKVGLIMQHLGILQHKYKWNFGSQEVISNKTRRTVNVLALRPCSVTSGTCVWTEITWVLPSPWMLSCASDTSAPLSFRRTMPEGPWGMHMHTHAHTHTHSHTARIWPETKQCFIQNNTGA